MTRSQPDAADAAATENLGDDQLMAIVNLQMETADQTELSELLDLNRESQLDSAGRNRLDELLGIYRSGMIRKARAIEEAVRRGLLPSINQWS